MRSSLDNPFMPGSDSVPEVWAGRSTQLRDWEDVVRSRRWAGRPERGRTILGEPGLGKSTLVRRIAAGAETAGDWVTPQLRVPVGADVLKIVATAVLRLADRAGLPAARDRRIRDVLDRVRSVAVSGFALTVDRRDGPEPFTALTDLLVEVGIAAVSRGAVILIHVDEVQNVAPDQMSQLLVCFGDVLSYEYPVEAPGGERVQRVLPIAVYLTGLPEFADKAAAREGATFTRRFATTTLLPLDDPDLQQALDPFVAPGWPVPDGTGGMGHVRMGPSAAREIVRRCMGEPFLFQLAGERAWYASSDELITHDDVVAGWREARPEVVAHVERILDRLPERERVFVETMAGLPAADRTATGVARELGLATAAQVGTTARRLDTIRGIIDRGRPYTFRHRAVEAYLTSSWPDLD